MRIPRRPSTAVGAAAALTAAAALATAPAASADAPDPEPAQTMATASLVRADLLANSALGVATRSAWIGEAGAKDGSHSDDGTARGALADFVDVTGRASARADDEAGTGSTRVTMDQAHLLVTTDDLGALERPRASPDSDDGEGEPVIDVEVTGLEAATAVDEEGEASSELTVEGVRLFGEEVGEQGRARTEVEVDGRTVEVGLQVSVDRFTQDVGEHAENEDIGIATAGMTVAVLVDGEESGSLHFGETATNTQAAPEPDAEETPAGDDGSAGDGAEGAAGPGGGEQSPAAGGGSGAAAGSGGGDDSGSGAGPSGGSDIGSGGAADEGASATDGSTLPMTGVALAGLVVVGAAAAAVGAVALQGSRTRKTTAHSGAGRTA